MFSFLHRLIVSLHKTLIYCQEPWVLILCCLHMLFDSQNDGSHWLAFDESLKITLSAKNLLYCSTEEKQTYCMAWGLVNWQQMFIFRQTIPLIFLTAPNIAAIHSPLRPPASDPNHTLLSAAPAQTHRLLQSHSPHSHLQTHTHMHGTDGDRKHRASRHLPPVWLWRCADVNPCQSPSAPGSVACSAGSVNTTGPAPDRPHLYSEAQDSEAFWLKELHMSPGHSLQCEESPPPDELWGEAPS